MHRLYRNLLRARLLAQKLDIRRERQIVWREALEVGCTAKLRVGDIAAVIPGQFVAPLVAGIPLSGIRKRLSEQKPPGITREAGGQTSFQIATIDLCGESRILFLTSMASVLADHRLGNVLVGFVDEVANRNSRDAFDLAADRALPVVYVELGKGRKREQPRYVLRIPVISVDGADVVAAYRVAFESLEKARRGAGPTIIRGIRYAPHFKRRLLHPRFDTDDPVFRMERYLAHRNLWSPESRKQIESEFAREWHAQESKRDRQYRSQ